MYFMKDRISFIFLPIFFAAFFLLFATPASAAECQCTTGNRDEATCSACVSACNSAGGTMTGFGGEGGSSCSADGRVIQGASELGGAVCACSDGRAPLVSDPSLQDCCSACGDTPGRYAESVNYNGAPAACPANPEGAGSGDTRVRTPSGFGYRNPLGTTNVNTVINRIVRAALGIVGALFLGMFIYGGITWMTAGGDADRVKKAKQALINSVIGMLIVAFSYTILNVLFSVAGSLVS
jgi:hypothetical protein